MQEIEFTKEDEYCIRNFGYNTVGDYENLKQLEDKEHLIVEELEYRLQQKENIIKEVREYIDNKKSYTTIKKPTDKYVDGKVIFEEVDEDILYESMINELLEILDGVDKGE